MVTWGQSPFFGIFFSTRQIRSEADCKAIAELPSPRLLLIDEFFQSGAHVCIILLPIVPANQGIVEIVGDINFYWVVEASVRRPGAAPGPTDRLYPLKIYRTG